MRAVVLAVALGVAACGPSREEAARAEAEASARRDAAAARDQALRALRELESAIAAARESVRAGDTVTASRAQALHVSEIRRAIVVANVAVPKAREALSREDHAAVREVLKGAAGRLRDVVAGKAGANPGEAEQRPR
ncbi:MAG: hypothetical protein EHM24_06630 [Acidobacteria bacterium]|nr:MAG: hypothetical protein EHM24_06630 [Acidobacteriota bacterium]